MSIPLTVNGQIFNYPEPREAPSWGEDASDWAIAVTDVLSTLIAPTDIPQTLFTIANNQVAAANVQGLSFNVLQVRSAIIQYNVYRSTVNVGVYTSEFQEMGQIFVGYKTGAATWELVQFKGGSSGPGVGVTFTITAAGQVQYTSDNIVTAGIYTGQMRFTAKTFAV